MSTIDDLLKIWHASLCPSLSLAALISRNDIAHKWKAPYRSLRLRESVLWRTYDLLNQSHILHKNDHILGSRILLRSALESSAILIYLNNITNDVINQKLNFHDFSQKTSRLLLGSKNKSTKQESINIITILEKCDKRHPCLMELFKTLSESAHPNFEGACFGYSRTNFESHETIFSNNWKDMWGGRYESLFRLIHSVTQTEYNEIWPDLFNRLEKWIEENDAHLEATK